MEYVALDLETTGLDPVHDRVIEVGAVAFDHQTVLATLERLVDPGRSVPEAVLRLTGIDPALLRGAATLPQAIGELVQLLRGRQPVGHGSTLDVEFLTAAGAWTADDEIIDTLDVARILLPGSPSHSLPALSAELGLEQPRPHRAFDDAGATRQLFLRLREVAGALDESIKESMLALVAPYTWAIARFFADALTAPVPALPYPSPPAPTHEVGAKRVAPEWSLPALSALLSPGGPLATAFPEYEQRDAQVQMLLAVAQILERGGRLVVEAGTGTGKSVAYLIPALARALARQEKVVVSTATHTLQEQLVAKDIPFLKQWLPWDFEVCLLKGRANYVSQRRWRRYLAEPCADSEELRFKLKVLVWINQTESGDRSELRLQGREEVFWTRIASDPMDCVGVYCTAEDCYVHRARAEAERADLVVVNHSLLLADAAQGGASRTAARSDASRGDVPPRKQGGGVLPDFQHLIIDEAHHLEDAATQGLRREVDGPGLRALLERLAEEKDGRLSGLVAEIAAQPRLGAGDALAGAGALALDARSRVETVFQAASDFVQRKVAELNRRGGESRAGLAGLDSSRGVHPPRSDESLRLTAAIRQAPGWQGVAGLGGDAVTALAGLDARLRRAVAAGRDWLGGEEPDQSLRELEIIRSRLAEAAGLLREAFLEPDANQVYWFVLLARSSNLIVRSAPLNVGSLLKEHVFDPRATVIFTSASLAVGGSFAFFRQRVGLDSEPEMLILGSPFDYLNQALICLPRGLPDPQSDDFQPAVVRVIWDVGRRIGGRTLALFTSHRQLRDTYFDLKQRADLDDILILGQGLDGQRRQVLKSFQETERALLLGTSSFWEGIDVPGDRLSCVVMVRLPFPVPTEPVFAARAEQVADPFSHYALPLAALRLKQGFGRLIRRSSDRGAVVILDNRISSRDYGRAFLEVLPRAAMYDGPVRGVGETIQRWLGAGAPEPEPARRGG